MSRARIGHWTLVQAAALAACVEPCWAGSNPYFTLPLHAVSGFGNCDFQPVDCLGNRPNTSVAPGEMASILLLVANYSDVAGYSAGFEWDPSWSYLAVLLDCRPGQTGHFFPETNSMGIVSAFFCVNGPALTVVGRIVFRVGQTGCLRFIEPPLPNRIVVMDCQGEIDEITDLESPRLGRVCVGAGGHDACDSPVPVIGSTWGEIKRSYQ